MRLDLVGPGKGQCPDLALAAPMPGTSQVQMLILLEDPMSSPDPQRSQEAR